MAGLELASAIITLRQYFKSELNLITPDGDIVYSAEVIR